MHPWPASASSCSKKTDQSPSPAENRKLIRQHRAGDACRRLRLWAFPQFLIRPRFHCWIRPQATWVDSPEAPQQCTSTSLSDASSTTAAHHGHQVQAGSRRRRRRRIVANTCQRRRCCSESWGADPWRPVAVQYRDSKPQHERNSQRRRAQRAARSNLHQFARNVERGTVTAWPAMRVISLGIRTVPVLSVAKKLAAPRPTPTASAAKCGLIRQDEADWLWLSIWCWKTFALLFFSFLLKVITGRGELTLMLLLFASTKFCDFGIAMILRVLP